MISSLIHRLDQCRLLRSILFVLCGSPSLWQPCVVQWWPSKSIRFSDCRKFIVFFWFFIKILIFNDNICCMFVDICALTWFTSSCSLNCCWSFTEAITPTRTDVPVRSCSDPYYEYWVSQTANSSRITWKRLSTNKLQGHSLQCAMSFFFLNLKNGLP